jgi:hypothetical protein
MKQLPYRATTGTGDVFDIDFPLDPGTGDAVRVHQLLSDLLLAVDRVMGLGEPMSNGDVLQAMAMALAVRTRMIHAPAETRQRLAMQLLARGLDAADAAPRQSPPAGHA